MGTSEHVRSQAICATRAEAKETPRFEAFAARVRPPITETALLRLLDDPAACK